MRLRNEPPPAMPTSTRCDSSPAPSHPNSESAAKSDERSNEAAAESHDPEQDHPAKTTAAPRPRSDLTVWQQHVVHPPPPLAGCLTGRRDGRMHL